MIKAKGVLKLKELISTKNIDERQLLVKTFRAIFKRTQNRWADALVSISGNPGRMKWNFLKPGLTVFADNMKVNGVSKDKNAVILFANIDDVYPAYFPYSEENTRSTKNDVVTTTTEDGVTITEYEGGRVTEIDFGDDSDLQQDEIASQPDLDVKDWKGEPIFDEDDFKKM